MLTVNAVDMDSGVNAQLRFSLIDVTMEFLNQAANGAGPTNYSSFVMQNSYNLNFNNPNQHQHFTINPVSGVVRTNKLLDREMQPVYYLLVQATDKGQPPLSNTSLIIVHLEGKVLSLSLTSCQLLLFNWLIGFLSPQKKLKMQTIPHPDLHQKKLCFICRKIRRLIRW